LKHNKQVESYKIDNFNAGQTVVTIKKKGWQNDPFSVIISTICDRGGIWNVHRRIRT
jgi:hypothetical protein